MSPLGYTFNSKFVHTGTFIVKIRLGYNCNYGKIFNIRTKIIFYKPTKPPHFKKFFLKNLLYNCFKKIKKTQRVFQSIFFKKIYFKNQYIRLCAFFSYLGKQIVFFWPKTAIFLTFFSSNINFNLIFSFFKFFFLKNLIMLG